MTESTKTWVIGITDDLEAGKPVAEQPAVARPAPPRPVARKGQRPAPRPEPKPVRRARPLPRMHFALLLALTYLLGPAALLLTDRGRGNRTWLFVGLVSMLAGAALGFGHDRILAAVGAGWAVTGLAGIVTVVVFAGFSAWSRALYLVGDVDSAVQKSRRESLPRWARQAWFAGALGLVAPGAGLVLSGRARQGALTLWSCLWAALAGLTLWHAPWLWRNVASGGGATTASDRLEIYFLAAVLVAVLGVLGWVAQALESGRSSLQRRGVVGSEHGDRYALALLGALAVFAITVDTADIAQRLDHQVVRLRDQGCRVAPLSLALAAQRLDPSQSRYSIQAMDLYTELGREEQAEKVRGRLDRNLGSFVELMMAEGSVPAADGIHYATGANRRSQASPTDPSVTEPGGIAAIAGTTVTPPKSESESMPADVTAPAWAAPTAYFGTMMTPDPK